MRHGSGSDNAWFQTSVSANLILIAALTPFNRTGLSLSPRATDNHIVTQHLPKLTLLAHAAFWLAGSVGLLAQDIAPRTKPTAGHRIVKTFDFDEHGAGNLDEIPMMWEKHEAVGFPDYALGKFDRIVGHDSPPSFYLDLNGNNCAYSYAGLDIAAEPNSDYRIVAYVMPDRLNHARAFISAYFLDANGERIADSERTSQLMGGEDGSRWREVSIRLHGNIKSAFSIGLSAWVVQSSAWRSGDRPARHIEHKDIRGGAWFDDIRVYRLPSVELSSTTKDGSNVFEPHETPGFLVRLGDLSRQGLRASLTVRNAAGETIHQEPLEAESGDGSTIHRVDLSDLPPGAYHARLSVEIDDGASLERHQTIVKLAPLQSENTPVSHRYGVLIGHDPGGERANQAALVRKLGAKKIKLILGSLGLDSGGVESGDTDVLIKNLVDDHVEITGTFANAAISSPEGFQRTESRVSLIDLFSKSVETWRPYLAYYVTRYENRIHQWQVGADGHKDVTEDSRLPDVVAGVRKEMSNLTAAPTIVAPWSVHYEAASPPPPADYLSVTVPLDILPEEIPGYLDSTFGESHHSRIWAVIQELPIHRYKRLPRLADFAKRMIYAHQSSAEQIFIRQPWDMQASGTKSSAEPNELFSISRTIISQLDDATFAGKLDMLDRVTCYAFDRLGRSVLVMWDDTAPLAGREYQLYLCGADKTIDLWGNQETLQRQESNHRIRLSPLPIFVYPAESWLVKFRQGLRFDPQLLRSESVKHDHNLLLTNSRTDPISGSIRLRGPKGWHIKPANLSFAVQPGETLARRVAIQAAPRESAGVKQIEALVRIDASKMYEFSAHLPIRLDLADMVVWVDLVLSGDNLTIQHGVSNRSDEVVTFRSFADAPGRKRTNLNIVNLQPGQTVVKGHVFYDAADLSGEIIRVGLKQVKGPRVHDLSVTVP